MISTSTIQGLSVLSGLITATTVKAEANSTGIAAGGTSNEDGSRFANLVVAGIPVSATVAPNTTIALPGIGHVVLNEVIGPVNGPVSKITVNMIHVVVSTANSLGLAVGTNIIVASASSSFGAEAAPFSPSADAYSLFVKGLAGNIKLTSGPWAWATVGCEPGSDTERLASVSTPAGTVGTMVNSVLTTNSESASSANANSNTSSVNLLHGLITSANIITHATVNRTGSSFTTTGSTEFISLAIAGNSLGANVPPNTKIALAGLGYVIVNDQTGASNAKSAYEEVNGLLVVVTTANSFNLPIGAQIIVAQSRGQVRGN